jgi:hypothetical protein
MILQTKNAIKTHDLCRKGHAQNRIADGCILAKSHFNLFTKMPEFEHSTPDVEKMAWA